jgi:hypothetical protein
MRHDSVRPEQRYTRDRPCPICGGHNGIPMGQGARCWGFKSPDEEWAVCTRVEASGNLPRTNAGFHHRLIGVCACGQTHAIPAEPKEPRAGIGGGGGSHHRGRSIPAGEIDRYYVYRDEQGRPVHRTVRYRNPKDFRQQRYDRGVWCWGVLGDVDQLLLYRLPELLAADTAVPVFVTEGERDADRLADLGLVVTTNACGALKWEPQYSEWLRGRHVAICEDNDTGGVLRSQNIRRALAGIAASVCIIHFDRLPEHGDVSDWIDAGGTADRLLQCARGEA